MPSGSKILLFVVLLGTQNFTNGANLRFYKGSSFFNPDEETIIYTFGFGGHPDELSVKKIIGVYLDRNDTNTILVNWQKEASVGISPPLTYPRAASNAKIIGELLGRSLIRLQNFGLRLENVHLIGFSLGVSLIANAAREVQKTGQNITKLTCLDPAGSLFEGPIFRNQGVSASDANFVFVLHTNPDMLGTYEAQATIDVWTNCGSRTQPGCEDTSISALLFSTQIDSDLCSHNRSWEYFAEAVENSGAFIARSAANCLSWKI